MSETQTRGDRTLEAWAEGRAVPIQWEPPAPPWPDDHPDAAPEMVDAGYFIDWEKFWDRDQIGEDWLFPQILARGRAHVIYAAHKQGKSLLTVFMVARMATEQNVAVIYLDYEMTEGDLYERLEEMGYGPGSDFSRLHYALLPSIPPLDTRAGADEIARMLNTVQVLHPAGTEIVVIIDTTSRAVEGDENSADTIRAFYRHTGLLLKQRGVTWARLDHSGKDTTRGQRGSSAKGDDVDVVWHLTRTDDGIRLHRDAARMNWVREDIYLTQRDDPLRFVGVAESWPAGTAEVAELLDKLSVPIDAGYRRAADALKAAGEGRRAEVVRAAAKHRRQRALLLGTHPGTHPTENTSDAVSDAPSENAA